MGTECTTEVVRYEKQTALPRAAFWGARRILVWQAGYRILLPLENGMKPALVALLGLFAASSAAAQVRNSSTDPAKSAVCSVSGLVVKLEGSAPLPSSTVYLQSVDDHTRTFSGEIGRASCRERV